MDPNTQPLFHAPQTHQQQPHQQAPLAFQLAAKRLADYVGQTHLMGDGKPLRKLIENDKLFSLIFWGPPGCGKTSLSKLISTVTASHYMAINATTAKISDIKIGRAHV